MAKTFDANRTWDEAVRIFKANRELILILAGLFFLLPALIAAAFAPEVLAGPTITDANNSGPLIQEWFANNIVNVILLQVLQLLGLVSLIALFARRRPTVSEAIKDGLGALLPLIGANFLMGIALALILTIVLTILAYLGTAAVILGLIFLLPILYYLFARVSPLTPLFVFEERRNPITAIRDSWRLTKCVGWRIAGFFALLTIAAIVIGAVFSLVGKLISALMGSGDLALFVSLGISALVSAVLQSLLACILTAIYRQLIAREAPSALDPTVPN